MANETKSTWVVKLLVGLGLIVVLMMSVTIIILANTVIHAGNKADQQTNQLAYICSTTLILDKIVVNQAQQIQENFTNGTYQRLLDKGIITQKNINDAATTLKSFTDAHNVLRNSSACFPNQS
jgi:hypothetical protein